MTDAATFEESLDELIDEFDADVAKGRKRQAAETAYAIALRAEGDWNMSVASEYARKALALLESLPSETIDQVTSTRIKVGGVLIPELLHGDVVRSRLGYLMVA